MAYFTHLGLPVWFNFLDSFEESGCWIALIFDNHKSNQRLYFSGFPDLHQKSIWVQLGSLVVVVSQNGPLNGPQSRSHEGYTKSNKNIWEINWDALFVIYNFHIFRLDFSILL